MNILKHRLINLFYNFQEIKTYATNAENDLKRAQLMARGLPKRKPIEGVKRIILVSSGKGGVGKSTVSVNLSVALKSLYPNKNIGLLDTDVFGPSIPLMMNLNESPLLNERNQMEPLVNYGVQCMSMGFLLKDGSPLIWRGLMVMQALEKLMRQVAWKDIDYLIVDTPPGTGDTHLSLIQNLQICGVVIVTTPQVAALQVTKKGILMYKKLQVPLMGIVENMSEINCPSCSNDIRIFGDGTKKLSKELDLEVLENFPVLQDISYNSDKGLPVVISNPDSKESKKFKNLANSVVKYCKDNV